MQSSNKRENQFCLNGPTGRRCPCHGRCHRRVTSDIYRSLVGPDESIRFRDDIPLSEAAVGGWFKHTKRAEKIRIRHSSEIIT